MDRRTMLRGMGTAATAGALGSALAAAADAPPPDPAAGAATTGTTAVARPLGVAGAWAALRPSVVPRSAWQAGGPAPAAHHRPQPSAPVVRAVFVHHTDSGNHYARADVPRLIRSFYTDHIDDNAWDDIGYNFLVDRTGTVYEGRAGGIDNAVIGAHTEGFNIGTVGIAAIGSFGSGERVPEALLESIARIAAWKLGRYGVDPRGRTVLTSTNDEARYRKGEHAVFHTVAGHRDGYQTTCPGDALYDLLPAVRTRAHDLLRRAAARRAAGAPLARPFPGTFPRVRP